MTGASTDPEPSARSAPGSGRGAGAFFVGIDGGGTSVRAVLIDSEGRPLARARGPGATVREDDVASAASAVSAVTREVIAAEGGVRPAALWAGLAGAGREGPRARAEEAIRHLDLADRVRVGTDAEAAFAGAFGADADPRGTSGRAGLLLVAGTGSVAIGRSGPGALHRVGGWGPRIGDEGGGYWIARQALGCLARAEDGRGPDTVLRKTVPGALGLRHARELIGWAGRASRREVAALAPVVLDTAAGGDAVAASLVTDAASALRAHVLALLEALGHFEEPPPLALAGGLLAPGAPLRVAVESLLRPLPVCVSEGTVDGALGAALLARGLVPAG